MKQVFMQKNLLQRANIVTEDVPVPECGPKHVLISNRFSLISAGTETSSVRRNVKDMVVKAVTDPELRHSIIEMLTKNGISRTADRVHYEATKWSALGYSGCGVALEVGDEVSGIRPGDLVAYGGEGHAEIVRAAKNLCVRVPSGVSPQEAAFIALGSIALQAVRRSDIQVGDTVAVIGLGLIGQLVVQILRSAGARVIALDILPQRLELARALGVTHCVNAGAQSVCEVLESTDHIGADRVILCASTSSNDVIKQAVEMARERGRIIVVGAVGMDIPREPFYRKEPYRLRTLDRTS
jgi:polar amino acid transport system substrate-binding protein